MTGSWISDLAELARAGRPAVLVTVLRADGSTPREAGTKMVVADDATHGTIGGGHLELEAVTQARALLARARAGEDVGAPVMRELALGPSLGQCCGGRTTLLLEPVLPVRWNVAVFGAGHVGKALVKILADLPCAVTWIDSRPEELPPDPPRSVRCVVSDAPEDEVATLPEDADVVVMTHSHALDLAIVEACLRRRGLAYVGVIGSQTKRARFVQRLQAHGRPEEEIARMTCPVGVPGIRGKHPAVIAVAVAAQLLEARSAREAAERAAPAADAAAAPAPAEVRR